MPAKPRTESVTVAHRGRPPMTEPRRDRQRLDISREAIRLFRAQGVAATTGEEIAAACGLSGRTLWRYFRSKEACVEPVLSLSSTAFIELLRRWPVGVALEDHIDSDPHFLGADLRADDIDATLAVVQASRTDPELRAIWLVIHERIEPVLAEVLAARLAAAPQDLSVRVRAATLAAALRITMEEVAALTVDGTHTSADFDPRALLSAVIHASTQGDQLTRGKGRRRPNR